MALNARQSAFVNEYLVDFNATRAAQRAGYQGSENTLAVTGYELLRNPKIREVLNPRLEANAMTPSELLMRLGEQARAEYSQYLLPEGAVDLARLIADGKAHLVKGIKHTRYGINVEFYDAHSARELIGKHLAFFDRGSIDEPQHTVQWTVEEWKAEQAKRQAQAAETMATFEDDDGMGS